MQKEKKGKLPVFGVGPIYVIVCFLITTTAILLDQYGYLEKGKIPVAKIGMTLLGILFILGGLGLWVKAVLLQKIGEEIKRGKLITDGVYSLVRNPIYSAFLFVFTGTLCLFYNLYLLLLPFLFWLFFNGTHAMYGRKVAERKIWRRVYGVCKKGQSGNSLV